MGFESVWLFRELELDVDTSGAMAFTLSADLPQQNIQSRYTAPFNTEDTTTGRRTVRFQLPGNLKGRLEQIRIDGVNTMRLYGVRIWAKPLGGSQPWTWYTLPVVPTQEGYVVAGLPIVPTAEAWSMARWPFVASDVEWSWIQLPVDTIE